MNSPSREDGFTLIEVLISVLVLAVGVLGMAGLQATSIRSNQGAYYRSQASILAIDMADRIRANRASALSGAYELADFPAPSSRNETSGSQALRDRGEWLNLLAVTLPEGTGRVTLIDGVLEIFVRWDDNRASFKSRYDITLPAETFEYRTRL